MRNTYGGKCYRCGKWVEPGQGHFEKIPKARRFSDEPRWRVQHAECAIENRKTAR